MYDNVKWMYGSQKEIKKSWCYKKVKKQKWQVLKKLKRTQVVKLKSNQNISFFCPSATDTLQADWKHNYNTRQDTEKDKRETKTETFLIQPAQ